MTTALTVFVCQFIYVLLLGIQSLNVRDNRHCTAAVTSGVLGMLGYYLTAAIARHADAPIGSSVWIAFVAAGPCGIVTAMHLHAWRLRRERKDHQ